MKLVLTCEHGGNKIPADLKSTFKNSKQLLNSHRGWDPGALAFAKALQKNLNAPLVFSETSRLVVDLNRSTHHPRVFSQMTKTLDFPKKIELLEKYHRPFRSEVVNHLKKIRSRKLFALHLSIHSFTPELNGEVRNCEIGFLYDPKRSAEKKIARYLRKVILNELPDVRIRMNYPYKGYADGHTTALRKQFEPKEYAGIEIEFNQAWITNRKENKICLRAMTEALSKLDHFAHL
jgi:predicted N-formylglutamate amidohydrolase